MIIELIIVSLITSFTGFRFAQHCSLLIVHCSLFGFVLKFNLTIEIVGM